MFIARCMLIFMQITIHTYQRNDWLNDWTYQIKWLSSFHISWLSLEILNCDYVNNN